MTEVLDLRGEAVQVGDTIAYAVTQGRSANVRIGKVIEIVEAHERPYYKGSDYMVEVPTKLRIQVDTSAFGGGPSKPTLIEAGFKRFVKLHDLPPAPPVPKTREEMAAFAAEWDAKVEAGRK